MAFWILGLGTTKGDGWMRVFWERMKADPTMFVGVIAIIIFFIVAIFAPYIAPYETDQMDFNNILSPPSLKHPFGTDGLGRDIFSRIIFGSRIDLAVVFVVTAVALSIGFALGLIVGYWGGWLDNLIMRINDVFMSIPYLVLAMAVAAALSPGLRSVVIAMIVAWWRGYARLARGEVLSVKEEEYIEAAKALGASSPRVLIRHVIPNITAPILIYATLDIGSVVITLASLSFLGYGVQPPTPEWGVMVTAGRDYLLNQWWMMVFPGLIIASLVLGFNLLGDSLRDAFDPKLQKQQH